METTEEKKPVAATQGTFKVTTPRGEFEFPGFASAPDGTITVQSFLDILTVAVASIQDPAVEEVLKANDVIIRDVNGRLYFPRPKSP